MSTTKMAWTVIQETAQGCWQAGESRKWGHSSGFSSSSLRQWPKHCLVFCGVQMDSVLISQPSLGTLHVREMGKAGKSLDTLCKPLLPPFDSVSLCINLAGFGGSRRGKKMGLCLLRENSFIATATWFLKNCSMVGKWEIFPPRKDAGLQ